MTRCFFNIRDERGDVCHDLNCAGLQQTNSRSRKSQWIKAHQSKESQRNTTEETGETLPSEEVWHLCRSSFPSPELHLISWSERYQLWLSDCSLTGCIFEHLNSALLTCRVSYTLMCMWTCRLCLAGCQQEEEMKHLMEQKCKEHQQQLFLDQFKQLQWLRCFPSSLLLPLTAARTSGLSRRELQIFTHVVC